MQTRRWLITLALCAATSITQAADNLAFASAWVGKYPSATVAGQPGGLLAQPALKSLVAKLLPKSERSALAALTTEAPVREVDGLWVVNLCRPHNCPADMATLVIDGQQARLWIGLFSREDGRVATRWYGNTEDYAALPERIRADFLARHGN